MKLNNNKHKMTLDSELDLKKVIDKFHHTFWRYNKFDCIDYTDCNELVLSDKYYELKLKSDNIIDTERERINCFRNIRFPYEITIVEHALYNTVNGYTSPNEKSPLIEICRVNTYGDMFDMFGKNGFYPHYGIGFSVIDNNKKVIKYESCLQPLC